MNIKYFVLLLLTGSFTFSFFQIEDETDVTTFILVRHAEKLDDSHDPELSVEGYERATRLAEMFERVRFDAVYSTELIRTMETARGIAEQNEISISEYDHREPGLEVERWLKNHKGHTVLISGHSNSTPTFANELLGKEHFEGKFDESDYGNLLIVTIPADGAPVLLHLRY